MRHRLSVNENRRGGKISGLVRAASADGVDRQELTDAAWLVLNTDKKPAKYKDKIERILAEMKRDDLTGFVDFVMRLLRRRHR
jgi:hypothetical protein